LIASPVPKHPDFEELKKIKPSEKTKIWTTQTIHFHFVFGEKVGYFVLLLLDIFLFSMISKVDARLHIPRPPLLEQIIARPSLQFTNIRY